MKNLKNKVKITISFFLILLLCIPASALADSSEMAWNPTKEGSFDLTFPGVKLPNGDELRYGGYDLSEGKLTAKEKNADLLFSSSKIYARSVYDLGSTVDFDQISSIPESGFKKSVTFSPNRVYLIETSDESYAKIKIKRKLTSKIVFQYALLQNDSDVVIGPVDGGQNPEPPQNSDDSGTTDNPGTPGTPDKPPVGDQVQLTGLKASEESIVLEPKKSIKIQIYAIYSDGTEKKITNDQKLTYRSTSESTVKVLANGFIQAGSNIGDANIVYKYGGKELELPVSIIKQKPKEIKSSAKLLKMGVDSTELVELTAIYPDGTRKDVTDQAYWETDDQYVASIDRGEVHAEGEGTATITAEIEGFVITIPVIVEVEEPTPSYIQIAEKNVNLLLNENKELEVWAVYEDGRKKEILDDLTWISDKSSIVTVSSDGLLTGKGVGSTKVRVQYNGLNVSVAINVKAEKKVKKLSVSKSTLILNESELKSLTLNAVYSDGSSAVVSDRATWKVKNPSILEVDGGAIKALSKGETTVIANYLGKSVSVKVTVK